MWSVRQNELKSYANLKMRVFSSIFLIILLSVLSPGTWAQSVSSAIPEAVADESDSNTSLLISAEKKSVFSDQNHISQNLESVALSLALVLLSIFILAWFVKRFAPAGISVNQKQMRILSVLPLGGRDKLMLVDIYGTQMVITSGASGVRCLYVFSEPVCSEYQPEDNKFQGVLQQFMKDRAKNRDQD